MSYLRQRPSLLGAYPSQIGLGCRLIEAKYFHGYQDEKIKTYGRFWIGYQMICHRSTSSR